MGCLSGNISFREFNTETLLSLDFLLPFVMEVCSRKLIKTLNPCTLDPICGYCKFKVGLVYHDFSDSDIFNLFQVIQVQGVNSLA